MFTAPYFLAVKLEAFKNRGNGDGRTSTDFEDIVFILSNRTFIWEELKTTTGEINDYLKKAFSQLISNPYFEEWLDAHTGLASPIAHQIIIPEIKAWLLLT